jgi:hypothetical protein
MHNPSSAQPNPPDHVAGHRTSLLRAAADNELTPDQSLELQAHLTASPGDRTVIDFERRLRSEIAATAAELRTAPDSLRSRVGAMCTPATSLSITAALHSQRTPRFIPRHALGLLAASLAMLATGYLVSSRWPSQLPINGELVNASHRTALTRFLSWQHSECEVHADTIKQRFDIGPAEAAPALLAEILQRQPDLGSLASDANPDSAIEYLGAARCAVPGRGESVHIVLGFRNPAAPAADPPSTRSHRRLVSLFVQEDHSELTLEHGRTYHMRPRAGTPQARDTAVCVWRKNGLVYFLVAATSEILEAARTNIGVEPADAEI